MTTTDPLATLNPSILGQAEKTHNAFLGRVLGGTGLDEPQWVTLQVALAAAPTARPDLIAKLVAMAKYDVTVIDEALSGLGAAQLIVTAGDEVTVTETGMALVASVRRTIGELIGPAYAAVPEEDRAVAARVLIQITSSLSAQLAGQRRP
jgi:hypothetical protein